MFFDEIIHGTQYYRSPTPLAEEWDTTTSTIPAATCGKGLGPGSAGGAPSDVRGPGKERPGILSALAASLLCALWGLREICPDSRLGQTDRPWRDPTLGVAGPRGRRVCRA